MSKLQSLIEYYVQYFANYGISFSEKELNCFVDGFVAGLNNSLTPEEINQITDEACVLQIRVAHVVNSSKEVH